MTRSEPHPHQLTSEECARDTERASLNQAKAAALEAYNAAKRCLDLLVLDETTAPEWIADARAAMEHAAQVHDALVRETEW
jgi:hypothetical protein